MLPRAAAPTSPPEGGVATYATSGACASSQDTLWADTDLRVYRPMRPFHLRNFTAGTLELQVLLQITQQDLGTTSDNNRQAGTCQSRDLAAAAGARATRMNRLWAGDAAG